MRCNFTMRFVRHNGALNIMLRGDFDGSFAQVLLDTLRRNCPDNQKIYVDTEALKSVQPSGSAVFQRHWPELKAGMAEIVITGKNRDMFLPSIQ